MFRAYFLCPDGARRFRAPRGTTLSEADAGRFSTESEARHHAYQLRPGELDRSEFPPVPIDPAHGNRYPICVEARIEPDAAAIGTMG
jgi:hypothetical protein